MDELERQRLIEQRAANAQTITFVANQDADIVTAAQERAEADPEWQAIAAVERERVHMLMQAAAEERELATALTAGTASVSDAAVAEHGLRSELLALARAEGEMARALQTKKTEDDYGPQLLAEQAEWNRELLRHVAGTAAEAEGVLSDEVGNP